MPANSSFNAATGLYKYTPDETQIGSLTITFAVGDGQLTDQETLSITVQGSQDGDVTVLSGRVLDANDFVASGQETPIVGAVISLLGTGFTATTDNNGEFVLTNTPADSQILDINSSTAAPAPDGSLYAGFREEIHLFENVTNNIERPLFLPRIAMENLTTVDPATTTTVTNATLEITIVVPPHTAKNADGTDFAGQLSISEVPEGLAPADAVSPGWADSLQKAQGNLPIRSAR
ncbi:hypothetical protein BMR05_06770 [Methylococcaceae bacterium HT4]|nr:hypothetical protein BMR05_06770 [Methylococcaceae bacterium HT4]